ncbi:ArsR/SmtB family transcription factor [Candidatus Neomarinimicrobiota bacterium]
MTSVHDLAQALKALSEPNRLRILKMLELRPLCVCEITEVLQLATSTVSKHLSILRAAGLIRAEKEGKWINYHLNEVPGPESVSSLLHQLTESLTIDETIRRDAAAVQAVDRYRICHA